MKMLAFRGKGDQERSQLFLGINQRLNFRTYAKQAKIGAIHELTLSDGFEYFCISPIGIRSSLDLGHLG
jgi:hypothetical protein